MENIINQFTDLLKSGIDKKEFEEILTSYFSSTEDKDLLIAKSSKDKTLIDLAIEERMQKFLRIVVRKYPELSRVQDKNGDTILHYATQYGLTDVLIEALYKEPNLAEIKNKAGLTFIDLASCKEHQYDFSKVFDVAKEQKQKRVKDLLKKRKESLLYLGMK